MFFLVEFGLTHPYYLIIYFEPVVFFYKSPELRIREHKGRNRYTNNKYYIFHKWTYKIKIIYHLFFFFGFLLYL